MRLDARKGDFDYFVWDAEKCLSPKHVVWVDDETNRWADHILPFVVLGDTVALAVHQARKIVIYIDRRLVIINPVADGEPESIVEAIGVAAPQP